MKLNGAQILMEVLKEEGVDSIFGFPGGATIDIHDNLEKTDIRHYLVRHEQGAVHAADAGGEVAPGGIFVLLAGGEHRLLPDRLTLPLLVLGLLISIVPGETPLPRFRSARAVAPPTVASPLRNSRRLLLSLSAFLLILLSLLLEPCLR